MGNGNSKEILSQQVNLIPSSRRRRGHGKLSLDKMLFVRDLFRRYGLRHISPESRVPSPESRVPSPESRVYRERSPSAAGGGASRDGNHQSAGKGGGGWPGLATGILTLGGLGLVAWAGPAQAQATFCDRTPAVRDAILDKISSVTDCEDVTETHLNGMTGLLDLSGQSLSRLQENDFADLTNLQYLWLQNNSLSSLDADIFAGLANLEWLYLDDNDLSSLDADIFAGLFNLQRIFLSNNDLSSLPADIFEGLSNLQQIFLFDNSLSSLNADIFAGLSNLQRLPLQNNSLSSLDAGIFTGLANLQRLYLSNNSLSSLDADIFAGLANLQRLYLDFNPLSILPEGIFADLSSLTELRLRNTSLACLPRGVPRNIIETQVRYLPDCFGVNLSVTPTEVEEGNEGESITVTATLRDGERATSVDTEVTVSVAGDTASEGTDFAAVDGFTITIPSGSESATGTFTLTATEDAVEETGGETVRVSGTSTSSSYSAEVSSATVTIKDGPVRVSVQPVSLSADEGGTATYIVTLNTPPPPPTTISSDSFGGLVVSDQPLLSHVPVIITPTSSDSGALTVSPARLTFTRSNWETARTVTVTAVEDDDPRHETVTISHSVSGYSAVIFAAAVTVTVKDDEAPAVSVCHRTPAVQDAILEEISGVTDCADVSVTHLNQITALDLNRQSLSRLQENDFADLSDLEYLYLYENALSSLDANIFNGLANLQRLYLYENALSSLDANIFNGLANLQRLYLDENALSNLDANIFNGLANLQRLYLDENDLSNLDANIFAGLSNLDRLYLNDNDLSSLDANIFAGLSNLDRLYLYENALSSLDANIFADLSSLDRLYLYENALSSLDANIFAGLSNLDRLYLDNNSLSSLDADIFAGLSSLTELHLRNTSLACLPRSMPWRRVADGDLSLDVPLPDCFGVSLSVTPTEVTEDNRGESVTVTATLSAGERVTSVDTEVTISVAEDPASEHPATEGTDFAAVDSFTITIPSGSVSRTGTFTLTATEDTEEETGGETVLVSGTSILSSSSVPGTEVSDATVTIKNAVLAPICDRTPEVQTAILEEIPGITDCEDVTLIRLNRLSGTLTLSSQRLSSLQENDFADLSSLTALSLGNNALSSLPEGIFADLSSLQWLFLNDNSLGSLSGGIFAGLSSLVVLDLRNTALSSLPEGIFAGLSSLELLHLRESSGLECLPRSMPWGRVADGDLTLDVDLPDCFGVSLRVTPTEAGEGNGGENITVTATLSAGERATSVDTEVTISVAGGTATEGTDFAAVDSFTITIPSGSTSGTGTFILVATADTVAEPGGETVLVSGTSTSTLSPAYAAEVGSATVTIKDAPPGVSVQPTMLTVTEGKNRFYTLVLDALPTGAVTIIPTSGDSGALSVSPASLTFTPSDWNTARTVSVTAVEDDDTNAERVTISHSVSGYGTVASAAAVTVSVRDYEGVCDRTPAVRDAIVDAIDGITACADVTVDHLNQITGTLNLFDQSLSTLKENDFVDLANLEWLWLHDNSLSSLPEDIFNDLFNLQQLILSRNSLSSLDANIFNGLANLEWLYLGDNDLSNLDVNIFNGLANLQRLHLNHNDLGNLDVNIFNGLANLQQLYLDRNDLSNLDVNIFNGLANLQQLYLDRNDLSSLTDGIFAGLSKLGQLQVGDNGLLCLPRSLPWERVADGDLTIDVDLPDCFGVSLRVTPRSVDESNRGKSITATATLSTGARPTLVDTEVTISVTGDTAIEGTDFTAVEPFTITIPSGSESAIGTFTLNARRDTVAEPDGETVLVSGTSTSTLSPSYAAEVGSATVTINDAAAALDVSLSLTANHRQVNEGESVNFTITRAWIDPLSTDPLPAATIWVSIGYHTKILETGADRLPTLRRVAFEEGQESFELLAAVTHDDELNDGDGMVRADLNLGAAASSYDVLQGKAWTRVVDDDVPEVELILLKERVTEGEDGYQFQIRRSCCSGRILNLSFGVEHRFFVNKDYLREDIYGPYQEIYNSNDESYQSNTWVRFDSGETMKFYGYYPGFVGQYPTGPLGGYFRLAIVTYPYDAYLSEDPQEIPRYGNDTFDRRYSVSETDYDKTLRIDNYAPGVSIETSQTSIVEGDEVEFTIKRFGGPPNLFSLIPHNIRMEVEQTGDYLPASELGTRVIRMELGQTEYKLKILTNNDSFNYPDGSITVTLLEGAPTNLGEDTYDLGSYTPTRQASVDITDNDGEVDIFLSPTELTIPEGGSGTYTVVLTSQPTGNVSIIPFKHGSSRSRDVTFSSNITFSTSNWNTAQPVTVTAAEDDDTDDDSAEFSHVIRSAVTDKRLYDPSVQVSVLDNDLPRISLSLSDSSISENGGAATVTATLSETRTAPTSLNVLVTPVAPAGSEDYRLSPNAILTFPAGTLEAEGTVIITAVNNDVDASDKILRVSGEITNGSNIPVNDVELVIQDDDSRGLTTSTNTLTIPEGNTATYTVVLDAQPTSDVTVTPSRSSGDTDVTVSDALTFSVNNWNTPQTVTIAAEEDGDDEGDIASIVHLTSGGDYDDLGQLGIIIVNVTDNDTPGVTLSKAALTIDEGSSGTYTMVLNTQPTGGDVIVTPSRSSGDQDVTVSKALIFSSSNWNSPQTVTVHAADDDDPNDDTATITHTVSGANYGAVTADSVQVSVTDSDPRGVAISDLTLNINEGSTVTYTVVLDTLPSGNVTITPSRNDDGDTDVTVSNTLTFSTANWNIPQTVTVRAAEDNDPEDDAATITHAVSGADYDAVIAASVDVIVTDNDTRGITLSEPTLSVNEGSTVTYTVVLNTQPTGDVTITPSRNDDGDMDVTVTGALTFSISNWDMPQTITVNAAEDDDPNNDTAIIVHAVSGADYDTITAAPAVTVTVTDNDTRGITLSEPTLDINEGSTITYTVMLNTQPTGDVTVTPSRTDGSDTDVTVSGTITFSTGNWNIPQTVTVRAAEDDDASNDDATITHAVSGADYASVTAAPAVTVTVTDNDTRGVTLSKNTLSFNEGRTETYTVVLNTQPTGDVTVTPSRSDDSDTDVTVSDALTFSAGNWNIPQTVTVRVAEDDDASNDDATITHAVSGADYASVTAVPAVTVTVTDNDTRGITLSETALSFNEGSTVTYTVVLNTQPTGEVTVTPSRSDDSNTDVTVSDALTFSTGNWNIPQTVTVRAAEDDDASNDNATITHAVSGADYASVTAAPAVTVSVTDNDTRGLTLSKTTLSFNEGSTVIYTVVLNTQPTGDVTVTPSRSDDSDTDVTVSDALTFSTGNWNIPQTVTVRAAEDDDASNDTATITHAVSGADYASVTAAPAVTVSVTDNDTRGLTLSKTTLSFNEGSTVTYTVALNTRPTGEVTVTPSRSDGSDTDVTVSDALTFSTGNWNIPQTVTVNAAEDDDASNDTATITHAVSGADYASVTAAPAVTVSVTDNDTRGLTLSKTTLSFNEGSTVTYTVALNTRPTGEVTVTPSRSDGSDTDVTVSDALTFSTGNWNIPQTVTVNAAEDDDASNDTATITHAVSGADYASVTAAPAVTVTVTDNDTRGITLSETALSFNEGSTVTYTVVLNTQPTGDVTVTPSRTDDSDTDVTISDALTFSTGNWNIPQTVTVNAAEDDDASNDTATITHAVSGADYASVTAAPAVTVTVTDNDTRGITLSETALSFNEGSTVTYTVVLNTQPTGDVTVTPSRTDDSDTDVTISDAITFSTGNWNIPQTVTVRAAEDDDASNDDATITHAVSGADYDTITAAPAVTVTVTDNDTRGITLSETALTFDEGSTITYTVMLNTQPTGDVTVTPSRTDGSDTDVTVSGTITFSTGNWNIPQTVTVRAAEDDDASNDDATITHAVSGADYASVTAAPAVTVSVTDNDTRGITLSKSTLSFNEGSTVTYTVVLNTRPTGDVTVTPSRSDDSDTDVTVSDALTFSAGNWNIPQTVTVRAAEDDDASNDTATITHAVSGADYASVTAAPAVTVSVTDNDTRGITISETALTFNEGSTVTYTVALNTRPTGEVTVTPSRSDDSDTDVTVSDALTFSTSNWNIPQTVTVNAAEDDDASNDDATITHAVSGADYDTVTAAPAVTVSVTDNDTHGITLSKSTLSFNEGSTVTYTVVLDTQPTDDVTVTPSRSDGSDTDVTVSGALTFSISNWDMPQTITVNAAEDDDPNNDTATIVHAVSGADYDTITAAPAVTVSVTDNDTAGVNVTPTSLSPSEGGTLTYTVTLVTLPSGNVTITPSSSDSGAVSVEPARLTFTPSNWNTPRTVSLTAEQDDDTANETVTVSHSVSGYGAVTTAAAVTVAVTDDDDTPSQSNLNNNSRGVTLSQTTLSVNEESTATYTVVLDTRPSGDVTVTPSRSDSNRDVTVSGALTFSTSNWDTAQTVTISAAEDPDANDDSSTIAHFVSGADYASVTAASVDVIVIDDDTRGVTISETTLSVNEGSTVTYTVMLDTQPSGDVTITPSRNDDGDTDVTVSDALVFSTSNWNIPQTITVRAAEDNDPEDDAATIVHAVSGADYDAVIAASIDVIVTDNDTRGVTLSETTLTFNEGGTVTYTVMLNTQPSGEVTVTPFRSDDSDTDVTVTGALTFSINNWNTSQTVTVHAAEDNDPDNDTATIVHAVSGADYDTITAAPAVMVTVTDNDTRGITLSETALSFNEGSTVTYIMALNTRPTGDVTVTPSRSDDSDTDVTVSDALVFSTGNWDTPQTVTVRAAEDDDASTDTATITHAVSGADYASVTAAPAVTVRVTDNDTRGVTLSETALTFDEGGTVTYTVVLDTRPTDDVTVTPSRSDDSDTDVTVTGALTFSISNWDMPQTVTVRAAEDDDASTDTATIIHAVSGADYSAITAAPAVAVTVTDNETRGITLSRSALSVNEGGTVTYTVVLDTRPTVDVTVTPSRSDDSDTDVTVSDALTFSAGNWNIPQTVTVRAAEDDDASNDDATITHAVSGADYDTVTTAPAVTVTVTDNDTRGITLSETALSFNEGSTVTYTVVLNTQPTGDVTVTPSRSDGSDTDVTVSDALTFSAGNWNIPQTVTVRAAEDDDASTDTATITHAVSGADYGAITAAPAVTVRVTDNDTRGVTLSETALTFDEGGTVTYTVVLDTRPTGDVTVTPSRSDDSDTDVTVSDALTFSAGNWNIPQTVTVRAAEDDDASNDDATITHAVSGADYGAITAAPAVTVRVTDNDTRGVTLSETALTFDEGGTVTYTVVLDTWPTGDVTVTPSRSDDSDTDVTVSDALTFSTGNWNISQTVTVNAAEDSDASNDMATITHAVSGADYDTVTAASVGVVITDNDARGITVSETTLTFNEGGTVTYTVMLNTQPTGDVTVTPSRSDDSDTDVTVSGALTFSTGNWNIPQTVTVNAAEDSDASNDMATITHAVSGADYDSVTAASVNVIVTDNDARGITVSETTLTFNEGGTVTYTVMLNTQPTGDVTVTPSRSDDSDTDVTVSGTLIFSAGNWNTPQTVTVNAAEDSDASNDMATITHAVSGADYASVTAASVGVVVTDNDTRGVTISGTALTFDEGGTVTYTVVLDTQPTGDVTVTPSRSDDSDTDVTVSDALTFSAGNWNIPQTVTVRAAEDDDASNDDATITHAVSGADYASVTTAPAVTVTVTDNDARGVTLSKSALSFNEGRTEAYTVVLDTQPTGDVTVTPSRSNGSDTDVTVSDALTFSTSNWNIPQTVTVNAAEDSDASNDMATITHAVSGADYDTVTAASVGVVITDNDARGITVSETTLTFNEGGTVTYTVMLNTQPTGDVTVTPSRSDDSDTDVTVSDALTFSAGNWNIPQTVTVNAAEDSDASNDMATITHAVSGADYASVTAAPAVTVTVTDNDARGITVSETTLTFNEGGTVTYTVMLNTQPTGDVTVTPSRSDGSDTDVTVSDALTFSAGNWNIPQTVTVNAAEDSDASNDMATITHAVSGADYDSVTAASVGVVVTDNDARGITVSETTLTFNEGGTVTYTVVLDTQPTGDVTVTPSRSDGSDTDVTVSDALTFSAGNWNIPQIVTVNAAADNDASNDTATITHAVSGADYDSVTAASVGVVVTDNDARGVTISETTLTFNEGGTVTYTVVLDTQPTGDVTVTPSRSSDSDTDVNVSGTLTFSTSNWNTPQIVTVNAAADNDASNDTATITHAVSGADYDSVTAASVGVVITDKDARGITVSETTLTFNEGSTVTYTVMLNTRPTGDVTVTPSRSDDSDTDVTVSNALTFSAGNWNIPQTVTVRAEEDDDPDNDTATITHSVSGADYDSVTTASVGVVVTDKDARGITVSEIALTFDEGGTVTYTVILNTQPTGDVTVTPSRSNDSDTDVTVSGTLTFSAGNWNIPQTVTVRAAEDHDASNDAATITHAVSGADYDSVTAASVNVIVTDNDARGVTISETTLTFNEGGTITYTVTLVTQPSGNVTITPSSGDSGAVSLSPASLTFTPSNWDTPRTVSVTAAQDDNASNETVTVSHSVSGYGSVTTAAAVTVAVTDDDDAPSESNLNNNTRGVTLSESTLSLNEGSTVIYTVMLDTQPSGDVTVTPSRSGDADVTVSDALTFSNSNWNIPQTVTVSAAEDSDASNDAATIAHAVSGADYDSVTAASVDVTVIDNGTPGVTISKSTLSLNEGSTVTYTVRLVTQPGGNVTITPSSSDSGAVSVESASLTFTPSNWNTPRTVSVTAAQDDDTANETATVSHSVSGYGTVTTAAAVMVAVTDDDDAPSEFTLSFNTPGITLSESTLNIDEGSTVTYTVVLDTQPTSDVTVTPSSSGDADVTVSAALTFSNSNWNTPQTVTVSAAEDSDASNDAATISHAVSGADYIDVIATSVQVTVTDNDTPGITISEFTLSFNTPGITLSESTLNLNEGSTVTYTVVLDTRPTSDVTITPFRGGDADITVSGALTFSNSNWNIPQTVTVRAAEDHDASNDAATITHAVSGADYDSVPAASVQVTVIDNDTRGVTISESTLNIDEGSTVTYTVVLDTQPTSDVTVTPSSSGDADVTVSDALTFSNSNWNTPQTVTVGAAEDSDASNDAATIAHAVSGADYDSVTVASVDVTVIDNDTPGITLSEGTLSLNEGSTVTYTVVLDTQPTSDVTVTPSSSGDADVTVSSALTFSNSNWNTPQTVTVGAAEDSDASNDDATISHAVSGADYDSVPAASVQVTVIDNEKASTVLTLKVDPAIVQEEDGNRVVTLTGTLNEAPWATDIDVLVTVGASGDGAIEGLDYSQVDNLTLTIAAGETVGTTTFSLTLLDDSIDEHDETILVAGNSSALQVVPTTITIRNNDPMPQGWLSRFGRTVADQVLDAVAGRLEASRHMGIDVQLAGQKLGTRFTEDDLQRLWSQKITEEDVLTDSSFNLTTGTEETGFAGLWGHGSISHFRGREDHVSLDGEVLSGMLGMDWTHGSTAAGLLLSHASGQGHFRSSVDTGTVAANLTGLYPYAHYAFNEQLAVAGLLGYGQGDYTLTQKQMSPIESDLSLVMASLSGRGLLVKPSVDDELEIALKTDMLVVHLSSEEVSGMFKGAEALVTRLRLGLDGSRLVQLDNGHLLTPTFEIGLRRDGGDAETGFGADIGMGLAWSNPNLGIASDIRGRALLTHTAEGFHEKGLALNFSYDPTPSSEHGFSLSLSQTMGAAATGGMDALLSPATLEALDSPTDDGRQQFEARLAYGFPILSDAFYMTPSLGFARSPQNRTYGLGLMFSSSATHPQATDLEISLEGERREPANPDDTPEHSLELRFLFPLGGTP